MWRACFRCLRSRGWLLCPPMAAREAGGARGGRTEEMLEREDEVPVGEAKRFFRAG